MRTIYIKHLNRYLISKAICISKLSIMNNNLKYNSSYSKSNLKPNSARKSIKLSGAWKSGEIESYTVGENINGAPKCKIIMGLSNS